MNRLLIPLVATLLSAGLPIAGAQSATQAEKLFASAQRKATIDGDLKGAIEEYKKAVSAAGSNRALAAQALLRMAECHQKLGDIDAQAIYERLIRDYVDQKEVVALARTRLGGRTAVSGVRGDRTVWAGPGADGFGTVSLDGRYLTYTDWKNGAALMLRNLTTGTSLRLTSGGRTEFSAISRDGRYVAYEWRDDNVPAGVTRNELRVARLQATGISDSRTLIDNEDVVAAVPYDWSPDGTWLAASVSRQDGTHQIGLVSTEDGSLRVLKSLDWRGPKKIFFSPDGRYIAYDLMVTDSSEERHVFVMAVDGSRELTAVAHHSENVIMGWSPDGHYLLFASDRTGSFGLWAVPIADGRAHGTATLVKPDISSSWSLGLTTAGTMYVWKYASPIYVQASSLDLTAGKLLPNPPTFQRFISSRGRPDWSHDGKYLAYQSCNPLGAGPCTLWVQSMDSGQLREVPIALGYFFFPRWSPDGRELLTRGRDLRGRNNGVYRIDARTGVTTLVGSFPGSSPQWAADGQHVHYLRGSIVIERNLAAGTEREAVRIAADGVQTFAVSPDGREMAYLAGEPSGIQEIFVMPFVGGAPRSLLRVNAPERFFGTFDWTAGGRALTVARERAGTGERELWLIPVADGKPRKLDIDVSRWILEDGFRIDRSGKQIAFVANAGQPGLEIRALENFLPGRVAGTPRPKR
jgi:Tol biopolymer transport system component